LNIRDLEYLVAVHDVSNFSRAAKLCNVSQPTLSGQLKKLEGDLGASLIERSTRRVLFTPMGEKIVEHARGVLNVVEQIHSIAKQNEDPMSGDFHVGLIPTVGPFLLPMFMPKLTEQYPSMNFYLYELQTDKLVEKLTKGELDAVVLARQEWSLPVTETVLYREPMKLAVSKNDILAKRSNAVNHDAIRGRSALMLEDGHCLRGQALDLCKMIGGKEDASFKATSMDTLLHMVVNNGGMTLVPELACDSSQSGATFLSFEAPAPYRDIVMLTRKNNTRVKALKTIAHTISTTVAEFKQQGKEKVG